MSSPSDVRRPRQHFGPVSFTFSFARFSFSFLFAIHTKAWCVAGQSADVAERKTNVFSFSSSSSSSTFLLAVRTRTHRQTLTHALITSDRLLHLIFISTHAISLYDFMRRRPSVRIEYGIDRCHSTCHQMTENGREKIANMPRIHVTYKSRNENRHRHVAKFAKSVLAQEHTVDTNKRSHLNKI